MRSIREAMERRRAPFYLRRTKEAMVYFPERQPDGAWAASPCSRSELLARPTSPSTVLSSTLSRGHAVREAAERPGCRAGRRSAGPVLSGFLMSLYQRRLASSAYAMRRSLENRAKRLEDGLKEAQNLARTAPPDLPMWDDMEEMEEAERDRLERTLEAVTLAGNAEEVRGEIAELQTLAGRGGVRRRVWGRAKLASLKATLQTQGFFDDPGQQLLIFTEFKDTLDYLMEQLKTWGFRTGCIHGGMRPARATSRVRALHGTAV